jgi:hypothetical protein
MQAKSSGQKEKNKDAADRVKDAYRTRWVRAISLTDCSLNFIGFSIGRYLGLKKQVPGFETYSRIGNVYKGPG